MSSPDARRMHADLAWTWPIISPPEDYVEAGEHFAGLLSEHVDGRPRTLLDLGCGGGHFMATLKRHFTVTGVDVSDAMLDLSRVLNADCEHVRDDMRSVRLGRVFDAVFIGGSVDYMQTEGDLRSALRTAWTHLRPGGALALGLAKTVETFRQPHHRVDPRAWRRRDHAHRERLRP
ncbi:class I SAM-dependent methyltransferase [Candidatus Poribacteria bacterium]|nr:class I SAM-dependent methyltransferase [Candidatus Poribacteria bacterium]MBT5536661.1 class I SAM-dependent methyltransferase [Candidatus Poribacteria bacterium]MBT5714334.1 class I SAM-dependent methyltransferase [Candidatus Poribacteria bacterium]MBT7099874.1 class I SAM-dependent methyltransferase [Candidatus Poribacteria bacterium]MBT7804470.1 class I SAM-dependent methyltransferase [Candidatus Poribacteria bacterium]